MEDEIVQWLDFWHGLHPAVVAGLSILGLATAACIANMWARRALARWTKRLTQRTAATWDDVLVQHGVFSRIAQILPALIVYFGLELVPGLPNGLVAIIRNVALAYIVLTTTLAAAAALSAANTIYEGYPMARGRPIKGFVQVVKIMLYVIGGVLIVATVIDRSPLVLLGGFGAMTAVLMLIFRDTILSLVASVQMTSQDMIRVGDWIEMPEYNADGDVVDVALHTVRVQNWDKTITTIPTYKFIAESFKNWRGMAESGGRRIKRAVYIDLASIRFLTDQEAEHFKRFSLLKKYMGSKQEELEAYNAHLDVAPERDVNLRRLTNIGTFRAYVFNYLKNHPKIHTSMTLLVRQLEPGPQGLPLEAYAFSNDTNWTAYEDIQSDIFDHILAILPEFGLRVFQNPTGYDFNVWRGTENSAESFGS